MVSKTRAERNEMFTNTLCIITKMIPTGTLLLKLVNHATTTFQGHTIRLPEIYMRPMSLQFGMHKI